MKKHSSKKKALIIALAVIVILILPAMLLLFDKLICKTSKGFINKDGNGNTGGKGAIPPIMDTAE